MIITVSTGSCIRIYSSVGLETPQGPGLGATAGSVCGLLLRDVVALFGISLVVAIPLPWIGLERWLAAFPYRTDIEIVWIAVAAAAILMTAVAAVGYQTLRAASTRPVECLKYE